jgi:hypothetical protein
VIALVQRRSSTGGALANHVWSFAGAEDRPSVNRTFLQPFASYTLPSATSFVLNVEATYDWQADAWSIPLHAGASQVLKLGKLPLSAALFGRVWLAQRDLDPDWGIRFVVTFLLPAA